MGVFNDNLTQLNDTQEKIYTYKIKQAQEKEAEKEKTARFRNSKVNIELLLLDYFKNIESETIKKSDFTSLLNDIKKDYINNNNFSEYQKDELTLFTTKKLDQLKRQKINQLKQIRKQEEQLKKKQQKEQEKKQDRGGFSLADSIIFWSFLGFSGFIIFYILFIVI